MTEKISQIDEVGNFTIGESTEEPTANSDKELPMWMWAMIFVGLFTIALAPYCLVGTVILLTLAKF